VQLSVVQVKRSTALLQAIARQGDDPLDEGLVALAWTDRALQRDDDDVATSRLCKRVCKVIYDDVLRFQ
jgi:hypothetical protein